MRVNHARNTSSAQTGKTSRRAGASGGTFEPARGTTIRKTSLARGPAVVSSIDTIVALQAVDDISERRRKAMRQGNDVLEKLEDLKIAVLSGQVTMENLAKLSVLVQRYEELDANPQLADILRQIDLRARVELAKFKREKGL